MERQIGMFNDDPLSLNEYPERIGKTEIGYRQSRSILNKASGFLAGYDFSLNPYAGCSFGCTYCYAIRFSGRADAETSWGQWVDVKENAIALLRKLPSGKLNGKRIYMSSVTDPYQTVERRTRLTRALLEVLAEEHKPKLVVQTRSPDVVRDIDLYRRIEERGGRVQVNMTVTTDDEAVRRIFEPSCPSNPVRLEAISEVQRNGIQGCITLTPLLLVREPETFADALLETGVQRFNTQPFNTAKAEFVAGTRQAALQLMAEKLRCPASEVVERHHRHYLAVREVLRARLPNTGEGKDGFRPPF